MTPSRYASWRSPVLIAMILALVVSACSGEEPTDSTTGATTAGTSAQASETTGSGSDTTTSGETDETDDTGGGEELVLQAAMSEEATDLHPLTTSQQGKSHVLQSIFMPLLETDSENQIFSRTLESWEMTDDARTATLTVRDDVQWSDGTPMTAEDLSATLTLFLDANISNWAERVGGVLGQQAYIDGSADSIAGLTVEDDQTLTVELENPDAAWLPNLAAIGDDLPVLPAHVVGEIPTDEIIDHEYFRTYPVSSGPYMLADFVQGQYAELVRNDNWSLGTAGFDRVFLRIVATDVMAAQLESGELDVMFPVDPADVDRISGLEGVTVDSAQGTAPELWSIMFDEEEEIDVRVRQAMLHAIDREGICQEAMGGYCSTPVTNIRQIAPEWAIPTVEQYPDLIEYTYDPDRARELLAEAEADGAWDPNTTLTFYHRPGRSYVDTAIAIAQGQMAEVGINWEIINTDTGGLIDAIREQPVGTLDGFWVSGADFTVDPSAVETYTTCETARTGANLISYCRPELDELWVAGRQTAVESERAEIYQEAFRLMNQDPAEIYLYIVDSIIAYDSHIKGIDPHGGIGRPYWNIGEWTWEE